MELTVEQAWERIVEADAYPRRLKYIKAVHDFNISTGGHYTDVTTVLWVPLKIAHTVIEVVEGKEMRTVMSLPLGGTMWHTFQVSQDQKSQATVISARAEFTLGDPLRNYTVGSILARRLSKLFLSMFPEITNAKVSIQ